MDIRPYLPTQGDTLFELRGGPWDKLGMWFYRDHSPGVVVLDGHVYRQRVLTLSELVSDPENYINQPDDWIVTQYNYAGQQQ